MFYELRRERLKWALICEHYKSSCLKRTRTRAFKAFDLIAYDETYILILIDLKYLLVKLNIYLMCKIKINNFI